MRLPLTLILFVLYAVPCLSQKKCGADEYMLLKQQPSDQLQNEVLFERWLHQKISDRNLANFRTKSSRETVYTIPIVVHVLHQGEDLGLISNIPDAQIFSQIEVLNQDFRRLNADASDTPLQFQSVAADAMIEFVLAKRDPEGLPTNGIVRKKANLSEYSFSTDQQLKAESYWPAEDYLNMWVTILNEDLLGYAQFPTSNLEGLNVEEQSISRLTDGVVIDYRFLGVGFNATSFSKGRTGTHEVGHFLGLRHIWGSGGCQSDDFCDDTPTKSTFTLGCPDEGTELSCNTVDMFQNYLDFSDDVCMNLFTSCQSTRMRAILENSPRRTSLLTSKALEDPIVTTNDLGIKQIISPLTGDCSSTFNPQVELRNYGTNTITDFKMELYIDDELRESIERNVAVSELATVFVNFSEVTISQSGTSKYRFEITETNGGTDGNKENDIKSVEASFPEEQPVPYEQGFESTPTDWTTKNSTGVISLWNQGNAPLNTIDNKGMVLPYFDSSPDLYGSLDFLISPIFDLSSLASADVRIKYAYGAVPDNYTDVLTIAVSTDCGNTFPEENYIFQRFSPDLKTVNETITNSFVPQGPEDWAELDINITEFVGNENVAIAIIGHNGGGNNIFIDEFSLTSENSLNYDLDLRSVDQISPVSCSGSIFPVVEIKNLGINTVNSLILEYSVDGMTLSESLREISLLAGKTLDIRPDIPEVGSGPHEFVFTVSDPNGFTDENSSNDSELIRFEVNESEQSNPVNERFEELDLNPGWSVTRQDAQHNWNIVNAPSTNTENRAIRVDLPNVTQLGVENWLVSPVIDLTTEAEASLRFKVSYASITGRNDRLRVLLSLNCGRTYTETLYDKRGEEFAVTNQLDNWIPTTAEDWKTEFVDLTDYSIWSQARIAFVVTSQNGNNLYLDDIEFFTSSNPSSVVIGNEMLRIFPNPASSNITLKFDLTSKVDVKIEIVNMMGKVVYKGSFPNTLNQDYSINNLRVDNGIYLVNVQGERINFSKRLLIWN